MADFKLTADMIIQLRNGQLGVVDSFEGQPHLISFNNYTSTTDKYDGSTSKRNKKYDIVRAFKGDGQKAEEVVNPKFDASKLIPIWEETKTV